MAWGSRIKQAREDKGLSQKALGDAINASQQTIADYEGQTSEPRLDTWLRLSVALGVNAPWLAFNIGEKHPGNTKERLDRTLMAQTIIECERFVASKGLDKEPISPQKMATMLLFAYDIAEREGGADKLGSVFERLFALAQKG